MPLTMDTNLEPKSEIVTRTVEALARGDLSLLPPVWLSEAAHRVLRAVAWMAPTEETILITGSSGTGKSFLAEVVHRLSRRKHAPFCVIPIAGLTQTLIQSELFGHEAHAYTDAGRQRRIGLIEGSHGGTVFLDEIGDIHPLTQVMLLRFLQDRRFRRLGGNRELKSDVRVLAATNRDLTERVDRGDFREDLFFRIGTFTIDVPSLSDRREDIPGLAETFLSRLSCEAGKTYRARRISRAAMKSLLAYDWPGNIRELEKVVIWAFYHAGRREVIEIGDLPPTTTGKARAAFDPQTEGRGHDLSAERFESCYLETILRLCNWNVSQTARLLKVKPDTVRDRMRRAGLKRPPKQAT
jgi:DNA-binding NtrC family response regulator